MSKTLMTFLGTVCALTTMLVAQGTPVARTRLVCSGLSFPILVTHSPGDTQRIFIVERAGRIKVADPVSGAVNGPNFLDISAQVSTEGENGLLGLAFDPAYASNGYFYVNYRTNDGFIVVARYHATPGTYVADAGSALTIWKYPRPLGHNGGWIGFSPVNGLLYISSGDGDLGGTYDAPNRAQTITDQPLGKILRINPTGDDFPGDADRNYSIPPGNPFVGVTGDDEIWSLGVRNPWRCSFDRTTGDFYFGDVGMDDWEEVNFEPASSTGGRNYGWPCMEGTHCTPAFFCTCNDPNLTLPMYEYPHAGGGRAVTGGYLYRGAAIPAFQGLYFFADFLTSKIWSCRPQPGGGFTEFTDRSAEFIPPGTNTPISWIASFGEDAAGEVYVCDIFNSRIYQIVPYPCLPVVDVPPPVTGKPVGSMVTLPVVAAGAEPLTYQWRKDGTNLADGGRISGTQTSTLTIVNAQTSDQGDYDVVLTSPCGTTPSPPATLTIFPCRSADFNQSGVVTVQDLFDFLAAWFAKVPAGDFNQSGQITVQDLFDFMYSWFAKCL